METILANLTEEYFEAEVDALAEEKARKQTIEQFREESVRSTMSISKRNKN
jgi:hypothetical protein